MVINLIQSIDIFGGDIKLRVEDKEKVKTVFGGIFTMATVLICITVCWILGSDVIYRANPVSYVDTQVDTLNQPIVLNKTNYPLSFVLADKENNVVSNTSLLNMTLKHNYVQNFANGTSKFVETIIPLSKCTTEDFPGITDAAILSIVLPTYCIDQTNWTIHGFWGDSVIEYLSLYVYECDYSIPGNKCGSKSDIEAYVAASGINLNVLSIENSLTVSNYNNALTKYSNNPYKFVYTAGMKNINYFIIQNLLVTDSGFFTESLNTETFYSMEESQTDLADLRADKSLLRWNFYMSKRRVVNYRSYVKITQIFGPLGGILELILIAFNFILAPYVNIHKTLSILKNIDFNFNDANDISAYAKNAPFRKISNNKNSPGSPSPMSKIFRQNNSKITDANSSKLNLFPTPVAIRKEKGKEIFKVTRLVTEQQDEFNFQKVCKLIFINIFKCRNINKKDLTLFSKFNENRAQLSHLMNLPEIIKEIKQISTLRQLIESQIRSEQNVTNQNIDASFNEMNLNKKMDDNNTTKINVSSKDVKSGLVNMIYGFLPKKN